MGKLRWDNLVECTKIGAIQDPHMYFYFNVHIIISLHGLGFLYHLAQYYLQFPPKKLETSMFKIFRTWLFILMSLITMGKTEVKQ